MNNLIKYYNYIYLDPRKPGIYIYKDVPFIFKYEPFYIGKGTGKRSLSHLKTHNKTYSKGCFKNNLIKAILKQNLLPIIIKLNNNLLEFEALENETFLIKKIGRRDLKLGPLTNLKDCDKGKSNFHISKEHRDKISNANKGRIFSEEHKLKLKLTSKRIITEKGKKARRIRLELKGSWSNKEVLQLDLNNNIIQEFRSIKEAHEVLKLGKTYTGDRCRLHDLKIINNSYKLIFKHNDSQF